MSAGGGAMANTFVDLGDKLHNNFSGNMVSAWANRRARNELDENKRQFGINALLKRQQMQQDEGQFDRSSGMDAISILASKRQNAMNNFKNQQLKDSLFWG